MEIEKGQTVVANEFYAKHISDGAKYGIVAMGGDTPIPCLLVNTVTEDGNKTKRSVGFGRKITYLGDGTWKI